MKLPTYPELLPCPCCKYRTIEKRGQYDICPVCFWEDDFNDDPAHYSNPNHQTLAKGQSNFQRYGACEERFVKNVVPNPAAAFDRVV